jgi:hypothetical protein
LVLCTFIVLLNKDVYEYSLHESTKWTISLQHALMLVPV